MTTRAPMTHRPLFALLLCAALGCSRPAPPTVPDGRVEAALADLFLLQAKTTYEATPQPTKVRFDSAATMAERFARLSAESSEPVALPPAQAPEVARILAAHRLTQAEFWSAVELRTTDPTAWTAMMGRVSARLSARLAALRTPGDSTVTDTLRR